MLSAIDPAALAAAFGPQVVLLGVVTLVLGWFTQRGQRQTQLRITELELQMDARLAELNNGTQLGLRQLDLGSRSAEHLQARVAELEGKLSAWQGSYWAVVREVSNAQREGRAVDLDRLPVPNGPRPLAR